MRKVYLDKEHSSRGMGQTLAMDFRLGKKRSQGNKNKANFAAIINSTKRDLSMYKGISFRAKASGPLTLLFIVMDSEVGSPQDEKWHMTIDLTPQWQQLVVPFDKLTVQRKRAMRNGTNQILHLQRVEALSWSVVEKFNRPGLTGTIWLDEVKFY